MTTAYVTLHLLLSRGYVSRENVEALLLGVAPLLLGIVPNSSYDELYEEYEKIKKALELDGCEVRGETIKLTDNCRKYVEEGIKLLNKLKDGMRGSPLYYYLSEIDKVLLPSHST